MPRASRIASFLLLVLYPFAIFVGLLFFEPRTIALLLLAALLLRHRRKVLPFMQGLERSHWLALALPAALGIAVAASNNDVLLLFYPVAVSLSMLIVFGTTLASPPTMIERFARLQDPALTPQAVRYTRRLTQVWCFFFVCNAAVAAYTALFTSREVWMVYNGFVAYVLMGALLFGERFVRRLFVSAA